MGATKIRDNTNEEKLMISVSIYLECPSSNQILLYQNKITI